MGKKKGKGKGKGKGNGKGKAKDLQKKAKVEEASGEEAAGPAPAPVKVVIPTITLNERERKAHTDMTKLWREALKSLQYQPIAFMQGGSQLAYHTDDSEFIRQVGIMIALLSSLNEKSTPIVLNSFKKPENFRWPMRVCLGFADTIDLQTTESAVAVNTLLCRMFELGASLYLPDAEGRDILTYYQEFTQTHSSVVKAQLLMKAQAIKNVFPEVKDTSQLTQAQITQALEADKESNSFFERLGSIIDTIERCIRKDISEQLVSPQFEAFHPGTKGICYIYIGDEGLANIHLCNGLSPKSISVTLNQEGGISKIEWDDDEISADIRRRFAYAMFSNKVALDSYKRDFTADLSKMFMPGAARYYIDANTKEHTLYVKLQDEEEALAVSDQLKKELVNSFKFALMSDVVLFTYIAINSSPIVNKEMETFVLAVIEAVRSEARRDRKEMERLFGVGVIGGVEVAAPAVKSDPEEAKAAAGPASVGSEFRLVGRVPGVKAPRGGGDAAEKSLDAGAVCKNT